MTDPIPAMPVTAEPRRFWDRVSIVWLVPLIALVAALAIAWQSFSQTGPLIELVGRPTYREWWSAEFFRPADLLPVGPLARERRELPTGTT